MSQPFLENYFYKIIKKEKKCDCITKNSSDIY